MEVAKEFWWMRQLTSMRPGRQRAGCGKAGGWRQSMRRDNEEVQLATSDREAATGRDVGYKTVARA